MRSWFGHVIKKQNPFSIKHWSAYPNCFHDHIKARWLLGQNDFALRTLFAQEMIKQGVLMPWIGVSYAHTDEHLQMTLQACEKAFEVYAKALDEGCEQFLQGEMIKPVFRRFN